MTSIVQHRVGFVMVSRAVDIPDFNITRLGNTTSIERLSTEPIGAATVTFKGVPANSEIRVQYPDGSAAAGIETCAADQVLTWNAYAPGSANNTVRIVIIDMDHRIKEFNYETTGPGAQSIPIQPEADRWFLNP
jgi:hypothetical protein